MNGRDRLTRALIDAGVTWYPSKVADALLASGYVIVPPVKLGDTVYVLERCRCLNKAYIAGRCHQRETARTPWACARVMLKQLGERPVDVRDGKVVREWRPIGTVCYKVVRRPFELKHLHKLGETVFPSLEEAVAAMNKKTEGGIEYGV